jgi:hypothetical protein
MARHVADPRLSSVCTASGDAATRLMVQAGVGAITSKVRASSPKFNHVWDETMLT